MSSALAANLSTKRTTTLSLRCQTVYTQRKNIDKWVASESEQFSLLFIDIDNFKCVNDTHGHDFGDKVLKQIALRLMRFRSIEPIGT
ncbi:diguanylate cyclase [Vibrio chagasii]|nr:diguanylate cyclase [Vibrio chagasii]